MMAAAIPSYDQVCYAMNKLPVVVKQKGRITGSEFRQYEGFVRRDWESCRLITSGLVTATA
jgi:putative transposase